MKKQLLALAALTSLSGCLSASGLAGVALPGLPTAGQPSVVGKGSLTTVSNAELDGLIACVQTKPSGVILVNAWTSVKTSLPEGQRGPIKEAIEVQARAAGCL